MKKQDINLEMTHLDDIELAWPSVKKDALISVILSYLSVIIGGLGFYMLTKAWYNFTLIIIALILWGVSCVGIRRLSVSKKTKKRDTN